MPIDTSIYSQLRPVEIPSFLDSQHKAMALSGMALDRARGMKQMEREGRAEQLASQKQRLSVLGGAMDQLAGMPEEQRQASYKSVRDEVMRSGLFQPDEIPELYDAGHFRMAASSIIPAYHQSDEYLERQFKRAQIAKLNAEAAGEAGGGERAVERLAGKLGNAQDAARTIGEVESQLGFVLDDYDAKTGKVGGESVDMPGVSVPGFGRLSFYSGEARTLDDTASRLFNLELKDRSGAAVTTPELDRLKREYSQGKYNTEGELLGAMQRYKRALSSKMRDIEAANPKAAARYAEYGGTTSRSLSAGTGARGAGPVGGFGPSANASEPPDFNSMSDEELQAYVGGK